MSRGYWTPGYQADRYAGGFTDRARRVDSPARKLGLTPEEYEAHRLAGEKWCCRCQSWHPVADFGPNRANRDGLDGFCRGCRRAYRQQFARRKREAVAA